MAGSHRPDRRSLVSEARDAADQADQAVRVSGKSMDAVRAAAVNNSNDDDDDKRQTASSLRESDRERWLPLPNPDRRPLAAHLLPPSFSLTFTFSGFLSFSHFLSLSSNDCRRRKTSSSEAAWPRQICRRSLEDVGESRRSAALKWSCLALRYWLKGRLSRLGYGGMCTNLKPTKRVSPRSRFAPI